MMVEVVKRRVEAVFGLEDSFKADSGEAGCGEADSGESGRGMYGSVCFFLSGT